MDAIAVPWWLEEGPQQRPERASAREDDALSWIAEVLLPPWRRCWELATAYRGLDCCSNGRARTRQSREVHGWMDGVDGFSSNCSRFNSRSRRRKSSLCPLLPTALRPTAMSFRPSLGQRSVVPLLVSSTSPSFLHFTYRPANPLTNSEPQIWTSLPASEWQAIPFTLQAPSSPESEQEQIWLARIPLVDAQPGRFEYTFRLSHADGALEWLGSEGGNGVVELIIPPARSAAEEDCPFEFEQTVDVEQKDSSSLLAAFGLKDGRSDQVESFRLRTKAEAGWEKADGLVIERSE